MRMVILVFMIVSLFEVAFRGRGNLAFPRRNGISFWVPPGLIGRTHFALDMARSQRPGERFKGRRRFFAVCLRGWFSVATGLASGPSPRRRGHGMDPLTSAVRFAPAPPEDDDCAGAIQIANHPVSREPLRLAGMPSDWRECPLRPSSSCPKRHEPRRVMGIHAVTSKPLLRTRMLLLLGECPTCACGRSALVARGKFCDAGVNGRRHRDSLRLRTGTGGRFGWAGDVHAEVAREPVELVAHAGLEAGIEQLGV